MSWPFATFIIITALYTESVLKMELQMQHGIKISWTVAMLAWAFQGYNGFCERSDVILDVIEPGPPRLKLIHPCRSLHSLISEAEWAVTGSGEDPAVSQRIAPRRKAVWVIQVMLTVRFPGSDTAEPFIAKET